MPTIKTTTTDFAKLPNAILMDGSLSMAAFRVWAVGMSHSESWIFRRDDLAKKCGMTERTLSKTIQELRDRGLASGEFRSESEPLTFRSEPENGKYFPDPAEMNGKNFPDNEKNFPDQETNGKYFPDEREKNDTLNGKNFPANNKKNNIKTNSLSGATSDSAEPSDAAEILPVAREREVLEISTEHGKFDMTSEDSEPDTATESESTPVVEVSTDAIQKILDRWTPQTVGDERITPEEFRPFGKRIANLDAGFRAYFLRQDRPETVADEWFARLSTLTADQLAATLTEYRRRQRSASFERPDPLHLIQALMEMWRSIRPRDPPPRSELDSATNSKADTPKPMENPTLSRAAALELPLEEYERWCDTKWDRSNRFGHTMWLKARRAWWTKRNLKIPVEYIGEAK